LIKQPEIQKRKEKTENQIKCTINIYLSFILVFIREILETASTELGFTPKCLRAKFSREEFKAMRTEPK